MGAGLRGAGLRCAVTAVTAVTAGLRGLGFQALANALISRANITRIVEVRHPRRAL